MQRFIPSRLLIAGFTHLWKVSASGKPLLHLALVLGIIFGIMGNPHDGVGFKPGGTQQYKVQSRESEEEGDRIWVLKVKHFIGASFQGKCASPFVHSPEHLKC